MFVVGRTYLSRWAGAQVFYTRLNKGQLTALGLSLVILWALEGVRSEVKQPLPGTRCTLTEKDSHSLHVVRIHRCSLCPKASAWMCSVFAQGCGQGSPLN